MVYPAFSTSTTSTTSPPPTPPTSNSSNLHHRRFPTSPKIKNPNANIPHYHPTPLFTRSPFPPFPLTPKMTPEQHHLGLMPPPLPHNPSPAPPAAPSFTVQQLLAHTGHAAKPPSSRSCGFVKNQPTRPAHSSSKRNEEYEPILSLSLYPINAVVVAAFRTRVLSISDTSQILFKDPLTLPWDGCSMVSEGMVTAYLDTQVLFAAWQAVLRMAPAVRNFDLEMVKQAPIDVGPPFLRICPTYANPVVERSP